MKKLLILIILGFQLLGISPKAQAQKLSASIGSSSNVSCNGGANGTATGVVTGGTSPYTYSWNPGGQTNATATGLTAGTYTVTVTDNVAATATKSVSITQPTALYYTTSTTNESCWGQYNGTTGVTGAGGTPPYTYYWTNGGTSSTITGLGAGTFTMTLTDANGCTAQTSTTVTQPPQLVVTYTTVAAIAGAIVSGGTAPYTYHWYPAVSTSAIATGISAGTYTVTVNDVHICSDSALIVVSPSDTDLILSFGDTSVSCGNPSYFDFDVMISSPYPKRFNSCTVDIQYPRSEFSGDDFLNGGINVSLGPNFQYMYPYNDYDQFIIAPLNDSSFQIQIGNIGEAQHWERLLMRHPRYYFIFN